MNSVVPDSWASPRKVATPPNSTPSMRSDSAIPSSSIVMVQPISRAPPCWAAAINSARSGTLWSCMTFLIIDAPAPAKFIVDSGRSSAPAGSIADITFSRAVLSRLGASGRRNALRPQNVKKIDTCSPIDSAPLPMMNAAMSLSRSPENTTIEVLFRTGAATVVTPAPPLRSVAT